MIALIQRVTSAAVHVQGECVGAIGAGALAFIGVTRADDRSQGERLLTRLIGYRIFADDAGRMNLSLAATGGALLLVPQFTLAADTARGTRPGFSPAAEPARARELFEHLLSLARERLARVESGRFGADMQVSLVNDGPVTVWLES